MNQEWMTLLQNHLKKEILLEKNHDDKIRTMHDFGF